MITIKIFMSCSYSNIILYILYIYIYQYILWNITSRIKNVQAPITYVIGYLGIISYFKKEISCKLRNKNI